MRCHLKRVGQEWRRAYPEEFRYFRSQERGSKEDRERSRSYTAKSGEGVCMTNAATVNRKDQAIVSRDTLQ